MAEGIDNGRAVSAWTMAEGKVLGGFMRRISTRRYSLNAEEKTWAERRRAARKEAAETFAQMEARARSMREMLTLVERSVAADGPGALAHTFVAEGAGCRAEFTLLGVVCQLGDYGCGKLLVERGADPDKGLVSHAGGGAPLVEPPLATVIAGAFPEEECLQPLESARKDFCDWLVAHGASATDPHVPWGMYAAAAFVHWQDKAWPLRWLKAHGAPNCAPTRRLDARYGPSAPEV